MFDEQTRKLYETCVNLIARALIYVATLAVLMLCVMLSNIGITYISRFVPLNPWVQTSIRSLLIGLVLILSVCGAISSLNSVIRLTWADLKGRW